MYQPGSNAPQPPSGTPGVLQWAAAFTVYVLRELRAIATEMSAGRDAVNYNVLYAAPAKFFPGMNVCADGTRWNPGSGEGMYRRNAANTAWVFVG